MRLHKHRVMKLAMISDVLSTAASFEFGIWAEIAAVVAMTAVAELPPLSSEGCDR